MELYKERQVHMKAFTRFLKENGAFPKFFKELDKNNNMYSTFVSRYKKNKIDFFNEAPRSAWIDYGLYWDGTENGHDYWSIMDDKWRRYCEN